MTKQSGFRRNAQYLTFFLKRSYKSILFYGAIIGAHFRTVIVCSYLIILSSSRTSFQRVYVLGITVWIAIWWITEAIPIAATSFTTHTFAFRTCTFA